jgi:formylglycine-generating enzyme required for sulfatase activity
MGKYPVTQEQWFTVANLPKVNRDLDPNCSYFKGLRRPVESVSWFDAVEFCERLFHRTGRPYRLPSEAEWEYACRAGTKTPFHFGETITTDLANYHGTDWEFPNIMLLGTYGQGPKGVWRKQTTDVDSFPPNSFGLYDMHGNVWEWCLDHWHYHYEGAPSDGTAWVVGEHSSVRVQRGGGWFYLPKLCRSATRNHNPPDERSDYYGFRVVCSSL